MRETLNLYVNISSSGVLSISWTICISDTLSNVKKYAYGWYAGIWKRVLCIHLSKWSISAFWSQAMIAQEQGENSGRKEVCTMDTVSRIKKLFLLSKHYIFTSIAFSYHFFQEEQLSLCSQQCTFFWILKFLINRQPNGAPLDKKTWWFSSRKGEKRVFILVSTVYSYFHIH